MTFAEALRALRASRSLTQEELAERAGLTVKAVSALERGERRRPYPHTVRSLADALDLDPVERTRLVESVPARGDGGRAPGARAAAGLPGHLGPLYGRDADLDALVRLLAERDRPVLTLTGPGGVGKTTLALAAAQRVAADYPGGVTFVDLAAVTHPGAVLPAVAAALGVPDDAGPGPTGLAPYLADRRLLLVLDNLEQVLDCAPELAELVAVCPGLVLLATSRAPLRIRSEREVRVEPLAEADAVRLFVERANAAGAGLQPGEHTDAVAAICREVDGLPLAIELSASAASALGVTAVRDRVGGAVADGPRDLPPRQRSMEATLDWSVGLLDPPAVEVLGRLSVLAGGFSLAAAHSVAGRDVLDEVRSLREHSLLTRVGEVAGASRFRLLEPVRQYAVRRWGTEEAAVAGLAAYVVETAHEAGPALRGPDLGAVLDLLDADLAHVRTAVAWLAAERRWDDLASVLADSWLHPALRGRVREARTWVAHLADEPMADVSRARWLVASAGLSNVVGEAASVRRDAEAALSLVHASGPAELAVEAVVLAATGAVFAGDVDGAARLVDRGDGLVDPVTMPWHTAHLRIARGQAALVGGDLPRAEALLREAESLARSLGNLFTLATTLNVLANVTELRDDHASSARLLAESVELSAEASMGWTLAYSLPALAGVAVRIGEAETGARLFGASASYSAQHDVATSFQTMQELAARDLSASRSQLGESAFREAWDAGRAATVDDVGELARGLKLRARG